MREVTMTGGTWQRRPSFNEPNNKMALLSLAGYHSLYILFTLKKENHVLYLQVY